jgi:hypothetical protein
VKGECERCGRIAELTLAPATGGMQVTCAACAETYFVAVAEATPPPVAPPSPPSENACPKCGAGMAETATACPRCGLAIDHHERWRADEAAAEAADPLMSELWEAARARWNDPAPHDQYLEHCRKAGDLAAPARRYRAVLAQRPGDAVAKARLDQITFLAEQALLATAMPREAKRTSPVTIAVVVVLCALVAVGAFIMLQRMWPK